MINLYDPEILDEDIHSVMSALQNKYLSGNSKPVKEFETSLSNYLGVKYVSSCSSGTAALHLALLSMDISHGDEVIMPALSYIATANAVKYVGGVPVFIDVDDSTWQIDIEKIENKITKKTKAIMPVHLYGNIPDLDSIAVLAEKYNLKIIHDSAEALGSKYKDTFSTNIQDVSILSFFPNKVITTGEGGAVCTNNKNIYNFVEKLKSQGLDGDREYFHSHIGYNYRMSGLSAALGIPQIKRIEDNITRKKLLFDKYKFELNKLGFKFQEVHKEVSSSFWLIATLMPESHSRDEFKTSLFGNGIETRNVFIPLSEQVPYKTSDKNNLFPNALDISERGICLPSSPGLNDKDFNFIIKTIKNLF